ncbi:hypothetical protein WJU23_10265 [Prosthecobacter sp. SYSU 5D2]|uniref:hypothetical protein n=1 Tax=Prosthecobacter sp. SYSU 5D2 TaxID=3134134 RepID=UPI0031FEB745
MLLQLLTGLCLFASSGAILAQSGPRPYLQQLGTDEAVRGVTVARNGHTFMLLSSGQLIVAGPDQIVRAPIEHQALANPRGIATSPSGEFDDTMVDLYVITDTAVNKVSYNTETRELSPLVLFSFPFPTSPVHEPVAITVAPNGTGGVAGGIFVSGHKKAGTVGAPLAQRAFLMKFDTSLVQQGSTREWGVPTSFAAGTRVSSGENKVHAITADPDGNVYVSAQWPSVRSTQIVNFFDFYTRSSIWGVTDSAVGLAGVAGAPTVQTSIGQYSRTIFFIGIPLYSQTYNIGADAENRTGYVVKFNSSLAPSRYTHTTGQVPFRDFWAVGNFASNVSQMTDLRFGADGFLYATGNWQGYSDYGNEQTVGTSSNIHVLKFNSSLVLDKRAKATATGSTHPAYSLDVAPDGKVYVTGVTEDSSTLFTDTDGTTTDITLGGRGIFIGQLNSNLGWTSVKKSNSPAPAALRPAILRWNPESNHAQVVGTFTTGQLSLGNPSRPALVPTGAVAGDVNYYALAGADGELINQINVVVRSEFVLGSQILTRLGDNPAIPLTNFDPVTREGTVGLLSDAAGAAVTITVPQNVYMNAQGAQVFPEFQNGNEVAPPEAVSRHKCTGFSVSGEATTGATNTYTFAVSTDTKVIFNWQSEHALQVFSSVTSDLGLPGSTAALGDPQPTVNKHWYPANEPVTAFIDNAAMDYSVYGKRYRVTGFDATGSILKRDSGGALPPLPPGRVLRTIVGTIGANGTTVTPTQPVPLQKGWVVKGPGVAADTTIVSIVLLGDNATSFELSKSATPGTDVKLTFENTKIQVTVGSTLVQNTTSATLAVPTGVQPGWQVSGPGIAEGTLVSTVASSTQLTLSKPTVPLRRTARTTAPQQMPELTVPTVLQAGTTSATIEGVSQVAVGMQITPVANKIGAGTLVNAVTDDVTTISTTLTNGSAEATVPYRDFLPEGTPVSGSFIPTNTILLATEGTGVTINSTLSSGNDEVRIPPTHVLVSGIPVTGPGIPSGTTLVSSADDNTSLNGLILGGNANVRTTVSAGTPITVGAVLNSSAFFLAGTAVTNKQTIQNTRTATYASGINSITLVPDANPLRIGDVVTGTGIPANTTVTSITGSIITLSNLTTAAGTGASLTFSYIQLTMSNAALAGTPSTDASLTFTLAKILTLSASATVTGQQDLNFITTLKLTLSNAATSTATPTLSYILTRTLTLSQAALGGAVANTAEPLVYAFPPDGTATTVRLSSVEGIVPQMQVSGPGIPAGTVVSSVQAPSTILISQAPTQTGSFMLDFFNPTPQITFFSNYGSYAFYDQNARQQVPQWIMSGPATVTYRWITQFHVMVSTSVTTAQNLPEVRQDPEVPVPADQPGYGAGEHWFDIGSRVNIGGRFGGGTNSRELKGWLNATTPPFSTDKGAFNFATDPNVAIPSGGTRGSPGAFFYVPVDSLEFPIRVLWDYGGTIHRVLTQIGNAVSFDSTAPPLTGPGTTVGTPLNVALNFPPDRGRVVEGPSGSSPDQMFIWDALAKKMYPLRPGKTLYEYGSEEDPVIVEVSSEYPATFISHITHPDLPGINLDPNSTDKIAWQQLAYSSGDATAEGGQFISRQTGKAVILFSQRDSLDPSSANGNLEKETLVVKVVETRQWDEVLGTTPAVSAEIGKRLTRLLPPPTNDVLDTGFVVHKNARYNAAIYDRTLTVGSGPIIPVNQQFTTFPEDELVVIWFDKPDAATGISWTHSIQRFEPQWPLDPPRIVMASRLGSEGKDADGDDQLVFTQDKHANVIIYNQPDRELPGYNPNEEHALIAPSLKLQDEANPPPAAYALQTGALNVLATDETYTSHPYVLVQYKDVEADEDKMQVYTIQGEDASRELNPWIDPRNQRAYNYTFDYTMTVAEPVQPPYPLARVIGLNPPPDTFGVNTSPSRIYWEDYNGVPYAAGKGAFSSFYYYRMNDTFWHGEGEDAVPAGTPIPFGFASDEPLIQIKGRIDQTAGLAYAFEGEPDFDGSSNAPTFNVGDRFDIQVGAATEVVTVTMAGPGPEDFVQSVATAFPDGQVFAVYNVAQSRLELLVFGSDTITVTDFRDGNGGFVMEQAGILPLSFSDDDITRTVTSTTTRPLAFAPGSSFEIDTGLPVGNNTVTITLAGSTAAHFVQAVNAAFPGGEVTATVDADNHMIIRGNDLPALTLTDGTGSPLAIAGITPKTHFEVQEVRYFAQWPTNPPILKAGETLTFAGGEYRADNPTYPGLPGVIGWGVGEVIFDSMNPTMRSTASGGLPSVFRDYTARLISPLETRAVTIEDEDALEISAIIQPASGLTEAAGTKWKFTTLPASLARRLFYDPLSKELGMVGYVNDKTLGDSTLTAAPPPVYVLEPNIITPAERAAMLAIPELETNAAWRAAVNELYAFSRNPNEVTQGAADIGQTPYYAGLTQAYQRDSSTGEIVYDAEGEPVMEPNSAMPAKTFGPGLALVPGPAFMDPDRLLPESYVTLVENNDEDIGGPVTLRVVKVVKNSRFRGAIKTITSDNVFSEQLTMRHSGDFGGNADDLVYQWYYREEDGTEAPLPPAAAWNLYADDSDNEPRGLGMYQIELKGNPILLLADQLFFLRYRHKNEDPAGGPNSTNWAGTQWEEYGSEWAGAANSRPGAYQPQLAMGWVKRVLDRINPYEARFNDFRNNSAPSTYVSMILQAGQRYEGPVALNPDKNVVENVGLIELYGTVLDRASDLSINLSTPVVTGGINNALLLAATRVTDLYLLLGNEAYADSLDPTIGFGSNSTEYGQAVTNIFSFQNQLPSLLDEELALLRGIPQSYGRPVYNRLFWNFTKSEGEVAYAMNYNLTDINKDGFINESDAMIFFPQGHGDAWGHYLSAIKSQYNLLKHPYFNWVSRSEFYNLLDVVVAVDYYDERKFADAASARAKAGAEIVDMTYRSRYVEDPDGQWQGYSDTDADRAWGVDGWAKRAGQGAYLDWVTANALIPAEDTVKTGIQKVDRSTVTAIHNVSAQLARIQATEDNSSAGLNPLGISPDAVPFDFDPVIAGPGGQTHFEQIAARAEQAITNAFHIFNHANEHSNRLRMQGVEAHDFAKQTYEQDRDYRNRLIEIFGTPYTGQIGPGKAYPTGYTGPDLALHMYVDVNDLSDETVPPPNEMFKDVWASFPQMVEIDPRSFQLGVTNLTIEEQFKDVFSHYFLADVIEAKADGFGNKISDAFSNASRETAYGNITGVTSYFNGMSLEMNLPISAAGYTFRAPEGWGFRQAPGELQAVISELVQAQAALGYAVGDYDYLILDIQAAAQALRAQHGLSSASIQVKNYVRDVTLALNLVIAGLNVVSSSFETQISLTSDFSDALAEFFPKVVGVATDATSAARGAAKTGGFISSTGFTALKIATDTIIEGIGIARDDLATQSDIAIEKLGYELEIQQKLKEIEMMMWNEAALRVDVFAKLEAMRQISDRYRSVLQKGLALVDERADFNRQAAGAVQQLRYQDMGFRVFRNDSLQKYRAAFDLAQRYTYLAAKAYDYETNLAPDDPGSSQPMLQEIVRSRMIGEWYFGITPARGGVAEQLVKLRANYDVLKGRMGLNNPQTESSGFSLRNEQARTNATGWKQLLENSRKTDLWEVPEFRRFCRPPQARSLGKLPGIVLEFSSETLFGRNFFGRPLGAGDTAFNPTNFANKIMAAGISFDGYPVASLAATPQVYLVPAGLDVMTVPNSPDLQTRSWTVVDQALPVPYPVNSSNLASTDWIPVTDGLTGPMAAIRRFSSFRAGITAAEPPLAYDTRLAGRSVWNTKWLLIIPGGSMLNDGNKALDQFINRVTDIKLHLDTYGYSGN